MSKSFDTVNLIRDADDDGTLDQVETAVASLVNSAPTTLDTLDELAQALNDDPYIANTLNNAIGLRTSNAYIQAQDYLAPNPSTGYVGIADAASSPAQQLHLTNDESTTRVLVENANTSGKQASVDLKNAVREYRIINQFDGKYQLYDQTGGVARYTIDTNGDFGIGTTDPAAPLDVIGAMRTGTDATHWGQISGLSGALYISHRNDTADGAIIFGGNGGGPFTEKMRLTPSGNFGIGNNSPIAQLHVHDATSGSGRGIRVTTGSASSSDDAHVILQGRANFGYEGGRITISDKNENGTTSNKNLDISLSGANVLQVAASGAVNLNGTLDIDDGGATGPAVNIEGGGTSTGSPANNENTLFLKARNGTTSLSTGIGFWGTFDNFPADTNHRRAADIRAGYYSGGGTWGGEYISFNVGNGAGASNDAAIMTTERVIITKDAMTANVDIKDTVGNVRTPRRTYHNGGDLTLEDEGVLFIAGSSTISTLTIGSPAAGAIMAVYNDKGTSITLACGTAISHMRIGADNNNTHNATLTLGARSLTTITVVATNVAIITGTDVS